MPQLQYTVIRYGSETHTMELGTHEAVETKATGHASHYAKQNKKMHYPYVP